MIGILKTGSRGDDVKTLQTQLNAQLKPSPMLPADGVYGMGTRNAVISFQRNNWLIEDGEAGPCTWNALMGAEAYAPILYSIPFLPQPTRTTCWATSTAMLTNTTIPSVIARTPSDLVLPDGALGNLSDTTDPVTGRLVSRMPTFSDW
jgi:peptidoglycan hydrolase-like protein with peptidoglycan-binding domain